MVFSGAVIEQKTYRENNRYTVTNKSNYFFTSLHGNGTMIYQIKLHGNGD